VRLQIYARDRHVYRVEYSPNDLVGVREYKGDMPPPYFFGSQQPSQPPYQQP